ncbi:shikimate kinase [Bacteroidota bacterium]
MKIVLIGYMGSGKSSIGRRLSEKLKCRLIDLDDFIVEKENASVKEIFEEKGEAYFRAKEEECLQELLSIEGDVILSLGGGTPCFGNNMQFVLDAKNTKSFYLKASVAKLADKLMLKKAKRPLIANIETKEALTEFIEKHLSDRSPYYEKAEYKVVMDDKSKKEVVEELFQLV